MSSEQDSKQAVVRRRVVDGVPEWGFDCAEGFANFGPYDGDRGIAASGARIYNAGEHRWSFLPIADCPEYVEPQQDGATLIAVERKRQVSTEGWTAEHDDVHNQRGQLANAAAYLASTIEVILQAKWVPT